MVKRRKMLIGLGALAAGSAAATGTGAFTNVEASRNFDVTIADDDVAFLGLEASSGPNGKYAFQYGEDLEIDLGGGFDDNGNRVKPGHYDSNMGYGVNAQATTQIDKIFKITNSGTQEVSVTIDDSALNDASGNFSQSDLESILTFYTGSDPSLDAIETSGVVLAPGESVSVGIEIDLSTYGGANDYGSSLEKIVDGGGYGSLVVKAEAT